MIHLTGTEAGPGWCFIRRILTQYKTEDLGYVLPCFTMGDNKSMEASQLLGKGRDVLVYLVKHQGQDMVSRGLQHQSTVKVICLPCQSLPTHCMYLYVSLSHV